MAHYQPPKGAPFNLYHRTIPSSWAIDSIKSFDTHASLHGNYIRTQKGLNMKMISVGVLSVALMYVLYEGMMTEHVWDDEKAYFMQEHRFGTRERWNFAPGERIVQVRESKV